MSTTGLRAVRLLGVIALLTVITIVMTWPLALHIDRALSDPGDPFILLWTLHHDYTATFDNPLNLFEAPIFFPARYALAFSEHVYGIALFCFPFFAAGLEPLTVYNIAVILGFVFSALGGFVLCRLATGSTAAALVGATFFGFMPFRFMHLSHLQHLWAGWLPLMLAALVFYSRRPGWRRAILVGIAFFMNGLTNVHWFLFGSVTFALTALVLIALERDWSPRKLGPLVLATVIACALLLPFLLPYTWVSEAYGMRRPLSEIEYYSAEVIDWLRPPVNNLFWGSGDLAKKAPPERTLFPGIIITALALSVLFLWRRDWRGEETPAATTTPVSTRWLRFLDVVAVTALIVAVYGAIQGFVFVPVASGIRFAGASIPLTVFAIALSLRLWLRYPSAGGGEPRGSLRETIEASRMPLFVWLALLWVVVGFIGSLGTNAFFHEVLVRQVDAFRAIRVPARWAMIAYLGLSVLASFAALAFMRRFRVKPAVVSALLVIALLAESRVAPVIWYLGEPKPEPVYEWMRTARFEGGVLEFPISQSFSEYGYMYRQRHHLKPSFNGVSGFQPPSHAAVSRAVTNRNMRGVIDYVEKSGVAVVIAHVDRLVDQHAVVHGWITEQLGTGRLALIGHFDEDVLGAWAFAVRRNYDPAPPPNAAELLAHLRNGTPVPTERVVAFVDHPRFDAEVQGSFDLFGWAVAPAGVKEVRVSLDNGSEEQVAERGAYPPVSKRFHWLEGNDRPAFWLRIEEPPIRREGRHELQVEVVDQSGRVTRLPDIVYWWKPDRVFRPDEWHKERVLRLTREMRLSDAAATHLRTGKRTIFELAREWAQLNAHHDDQTFVTEAQRAFLGRRLSAADKSREVFALRRAFGREPYIRSLVNSDEFARRYLKISALSDRRMIEEQ
jgi:hypothetical protein